MSSIDYKTSEAQRRASMKWIAKQSRLEIKMPPEFRTEIDTHAHSRGESTTQFLIRAAKEQMLRDDEQSAETDENGGS